MLTVTVHGIPGPQGSKRARPIYKGRGVARVFTGKVAQQESSGKVKPWREAVERAAAEAMMPGTPWRLDVPLVAEFVFSLPRGKTVRRAHHTVYPDLSKLIRSTEDALTSAGVWADDARLVAYHRPRKVYVSAADPDALDVPGAVIRVWEVTDA